MSGVVYIVDDDESIRKSLTRLVHAEGLRAIAYASSEEFLAEDPVDHPGCLILDLKMPGMNGLETQDRLREAGISIPVIFLTAHGDVASSVEAMKTGAADFLQKPLDGELLLAKIRDLISLDEKNQQAREREMEILKRHRSLTPREQEVMDFVVAGYLNKQIAYDLGVSEKTVKVHRARVMSKMKAGSLAQLVRLAQTVSAGTGRSEKSFL